VIIPLASAFLPQALLEIMESTFEFFYW